MSQLSGPKRWLALAALMLALPLAPTWISYGQRPALTNTWGTFPREPRQISTPAPAALPGRVVPSAQVNLFLPLILTSVKVGPLVFSGGSTADCQDATGTTFTFGIKYLCVDVIVDGGQGQQYRFDWAVDGQAQPGLGRSGTVSSQLVDIPDGICYGPSGNCGSAIPRGAYQVTFFLDNIQYQQTTAVIK
jgi:hypothetical protein